MAVSPTKTRAMILLKQALDAGAGAEAMQILNTDYTRADADFSINWPAAIRQLESLLKEAPVQARRGIEVVEEDNDYNYFEFEQDHDAQDRVA